MGDQVMNEQVINTQTMDVQTLSDQAQVNLFNKLKEKNRRLKKRIAELQFELAEKQSNNFIGLQQGHINNVFTGHEGPTEPTWVNIWRPKN